VWLARGPGGLAAVKRLLPHLREDADFLELFTGGALTVMPFEHPNIPRLLSAGPEMIAMEYVHGQDLARVLRKTRPPLRRPLAYRIGAEVCRALHYAHGRDVLHRDVGTQSIRLGYDGSVKLLDFGLAPALDVATTPVMGRRFTSMAPEQVMGAPLDARSDVFTLGLVLYELLTGVRPFRHDSDIETLRAIMACELEPLPQAGPVVLRALARSPGDRYADAARFLEALEAEGALAAPHELAALVRSSFPDEERLLLKRADRVAAFWERGTVTLENEETGARWFVTPADTLSLRGGTVEITGAEFGTQAVGERLSMDFVESVAAASQCRVARHTSG